MKKLTFLIIGAIMLSGCTPMPEPVSSPKDLCIEAGGIPITGIRQWKLKDCIFK